MGIPYRQHLSLRELQTPKHQSLSIFFFSAEEIALTPDSKASHPSNKLAS